MKTNYLLLQIVLTKANSTNDPNMKTVHPINHISVAFMYDTFGRELPVFLDKVMKVNMVLVPVEENVSGSNGDRTSK